MAESIQETVDVLITFRSHIESLLASPDSGELFATVKTLWEWLEASDEVQKSFIEEAVLSKAVDAEPFRLAQRRYEQHNEQISAQKLLSSSNSTSLYKRLRHSDRFLRATYDNVADEIALLPSFAPTSITMVGCGAYPNSLLHLAELLPNIPIVGIDASPDAVALAQSVISYAGAKQVKVISSLGEEYDFRMSQLVLVGNVIRRKQAVLQRVLKTGGKGIKVLTRVPWSAGILCFEDLEVRLESDSPQWYPVAATSGNIHLLCRTLLLQPAFEPV